ncbi:glycosyl hydrolase family 28-related protein [Kribbella sp. NPDC004536]|uniref:glycosyl hydrolase family 28-related protein n=1 Tax=Kribbella sp. NPDC004536 TaxID=3364106 RepID=UPI003694CE2F
MLPPPENSRPPSASQPLSSTRRRFLQASALVVGASALPFVRPSTAAAAVNTPPVLLSQQVRSAAPGEALLLAGAGFDSADLVSFWPVPDTGSIGPSGPTPLPATPPTGSTSVTPNAVDSDGVVAVLPSGIGDGPVAAYVSSADHTTWSAPLLLNSSQAWYLDRPQVQAGQTVTIYGRELRSSTAAPTVYIETAGTLTLCSVSGSTNYAMAFTVPAGTSAGTHRLYVSNGHGGSYAFDKSLVLTVVAAPTGTPLAVNVVSGYGADPTGTADSTTNLQNALNAAAASSTGAIVTVPAGTYLVTGKLTVPAGSGPISIVGSTSSTSTLKVNPASGYSASVPTTTDFSASYDVYGVSASDDIGMLYLAPGSNPVTVDHLTFDANDRRMVCLEVDGRDGVTVSSCHFVNANWPSNIFLYSGGYSIIAQFCRRLVVTGSQFTTASGIFLIAVVDALIDTNTMALAFPRVKGTDGANPNGVDQDGIKVWGARRMTLRGNTFVRGSGGYYARAIQLGALKVPSGVFGGTECCGVEYSYIGDNYVQDSGEPSPGGLVLASNCGESIVADQFNSVTGGRVALTVSAATSTTVSVGGSPFDASSTSALNAIGADVVVLSGSGVGQIRRVVANTSGQLTVDSPWDVVPGAGSLIVVTVLNKRILYYNNSAIACPKYLGNYGPGALCVMAGNTVDTTGAVTPNPDDPRAAGIAVTGIVSPSQPVLDVNFFNELIDNTLTGSHVYAQYDDFVNPSSSSIPAAPLLHGNRLARNSAAGTDATAGLLTLYPPSAANVMARHTLCVKNVKGSGTTKNTSIGDAYWARSVYQGTAADLTDSGTGTVVI